MNGELQVTMANLPATTAPQAILTQTGNNGIQIFNQPDATVNVYQAVDSNAVYNAAVQICTDFYNLFVVDSEKFNGSNFLIRKECALTVSEGVTRAISRQFASLAPEAIMRIKTFPSLFAICDHRHSSLNIAHDAYVGLVTDIEVLDDDIRIHCYKACSITRQNLMGLVANLEIQAASMACELDKSHWAIKPIDLVGELKKAGLCLPAPF